MKRVLRYTLGALLTLILIAIGGAYWLVGTESGLQTAWRFAGGYLPQNLTVGAIEGRIGGPVILRDVSLNLPTMEISLERALVDWNPRALLGRRVHVTRLELENAAITSLPEASAVTLEPDTPLNLPAAIDLPVAIQLDEAIVDNLTYRAASESEPIRIDRAELAGRYDDAELLLREFTASGPLFDLAGRAAVIPRDPYVADIELEWTLRPSDFPAVVGRTVVTGDLGRLVIDQSVAAPYNVEAEIALINPVEDLSLDGTIQIDIETAAFELGLPVATVDASISARGSPAELKIGVAADVVVPELDLLAVDVQATLGSETFAIESLRIDHAATAASVAGSGRLTFGDPIAAVLELSWSDLRWPFQGEAQVLSRTGTLNVDGTLDDYELELDAALSTGGTRGQIVARGAGSTEAVALSQLTVRALGGELAGEARLELGPPLAGEVMLAAENLDPGVWLDGWTGRVGGRVDASGRLEETGPQVDVEMLSITGTLRERAFELEARGELDAGVIDVSALSLASGESVLEARATLADSISAEFSLMSDDLADFWPGWSGQVSVTGSASGPRERPSVRFDARGTEVDLPFGRVADLDLHVDADLAGTEPSELNLTLQDGLVAGTDIVSLTFAANGNADSHQLSLDADTSVGQAVLAMTGSIDGVWQPDFQWTLGLDVGSFSPTTLGDWQLRAPSLARITADTQVLERTCWQHVQAELCVEGTSGPGDRTANFALNELPFGYFAVFFDQLDRVEGNLSASGEYSSIDGEEVELTASLSSTDGRIILEGESDLSIGFGPIDGAIVTGTGGIDAELLIPIEGDGDVDVVASIGINPDDQSFAARPLTVEVDATLEQLGIVAELVPDIGEAEGRFVADVVVSGTVGRPEIRGQVELTGARLTLPEPNLTLEDLSLRVTSDGTGPLMLQSEARSGQGDVSVSGELSIDDRRGLLKIDGEGFEVVNTADLQASVSPNLDITFSPERIDINGTVAVPTARITPRGGDGQDVVGVSSDQVIVRADAEEEESALVPPIHAMIGLELGENVDVEASGLIGRLAGGISITEIPGEPTTASGSFRIEDGTYTAYGQELEIRTGRLLFVGGPVDRPGLDIEAVRRPAPEVLVGARVRGTLAQPELSLFSEPSMTEQEQLSYLVLGRPLGGNSSSEESVLARAALALGLRGGNFVSERLNERLGFDEFGVQTAPGESAQTASFVIGRYLSPSLYVSYGVGIFDSVSTLQLRYRITDRWRVETKSSDLESGGDIIWSIERSTLDRDD